MAIKNFQVNVTANGGLGINTLKMFVDYDDTKPFADFLRDVTRTACVRGYTAILHYNNYLSYAVAAYHGGSESLAKAIMDKVTEWDETNRCLDALKEVGTADESEREYYVAKHKENGVDLEQTSIGTWVANGCANNGYYKGRRMELYYWFDGMKTALYHLGLDPEERGTTRRICENLGMYRVQ